MKFIWKKKSWKMFKFVVAIVFLVCLIANNVESQKVLKKTCGPDKLIPGKEFDAVREVILGFWSNHYLKI